MLYCLCFCPSSLARLSGLFFCRLHCFIDDGLYLRSGLWPSLVKSNSRGKSPIPPLCSFGSGCKWHLRHRTHSFAVLPVFETELRRRGPSLFYMGRFHYPRHPLAPPWQSTLPTPISLQLLAPQAWVSPSCLRLSSPLSLSLSGSRVPFFLIFACCFAPPLPDLSPGFSSLSVFSLIFLCVCALELLASLMNLQGMWNCRMSKDL